jgi:DNA excision repair protein ERCC-2
MKTISLSVHDFVDLILRKGDIDNRVFNTLSMNEGTRLHAWYQSKQGEDYSPEYYLSYDFVKDGFRLQISGRADGIILHGEDNVTVDEIKTTNTDIDEFYEAQKAWHLGQAQVYAYMYLKLHSLENIKVQLTYISQEDTTRMKQFLFVYTKEELEEIIDGYLTTYLSYQKVISQMKDERQKSIAALKFPFPSMRAGQKQMMEFAKESVENGDIRICEAKTGIGKTISVLFPYIKALQEKNLERIFYLTSKNSIKEVVYNTVSKLEDEGARLKCVFMTSKDRICLNAKAKRHCNPDECPYAKDYYDKVNEAIFDAYGTQDLFREEDILYYAKKYKICPFELQLDMLNYSDLIVGDYNYLFDPNARLMRFFENYSLNPYLLLVDEAHNLPDRVRDMFSAQIDLFQLEDVLKSFKSERGKGSNEIRDDIAQLESYFAKQRFGEATTRFSEIEAADSVPDAFIDLLNAFVIHGKAYMKKKKKINDAFLNFYYLVQNFLALPTSDSRWAYYFLYEKGEKLEEQKCYGFAISCLDPRPLEKLAYQAFTAGVLFSATLSPKDYFVDLLGGNGDTETLYLPSPFESGHCLVMVDPYISTKFRDRDASVRQIVSAIQGAVSGKVGNYFVFFPSFEYLNKVLPFFLYYDDIQVYAQRSNMSEKERSEFLGKFVSSPGKTTLGFLVLGGIFSEGIDLIEDRLIGAIIVSVGLPKINYISDRIQQYFGEGKEDPNLGYMYAYTYPGINKVLQAAGRVIRGEEDRGIILYVDTRYAYSVYQKELSSTYDSLVRVSSGGDIAEQVQLFWKKQGGNTK